MAVQSRPPKGSTGRALASHIKPEPAGIADLVDQMRTDYQVTLGDRVIQANSQTAKVSFTAETEDPREIALAADLENLWWSKFRTMLEADAYGRVAYEKVVGYDAAARINTVHLKELPYRHTEMRLTPDGDFDGINVYQKGKKQPIVLSPGYCWWLAIDATPTEPHGKSRYLGAPKKLWQDKSQITGQLSTFIDKFIYDSGLVHGPDSYPNPLGDDLPPIDGAAAFDAARKTARAGNVVYASNKRIETSDGSVGPYELDFERYETNITSAAPITDIINYLDMCQLLARGIAPKLVMDNTAGSLALVSQQMLILMAVVDELVGQPVESFQKYVIDKIVAVNDASGRWKITANFTPLTQRPDDLAETLVKAWLTTPDLSPLILSGAVDVVPILESVGLSISEGAGLKLQRWVDANAAAGAVLPRARAVDSPVAMDLPSFLPRLWA